MANPWEKYATPDAPASGRPWEKYGAAPPTAPDKPGYLSQVGSGLANTIKGLASVGYHTGGAVFDPINAIDHLKELKRLVLDPQVDQAIKAGDKWKSGDRSEAVGHALAALIPGVGPAAANIGEKLGDQDYTGAAADATVLGATLAAPKVIPKAAEVAGRAAGKVADLKQVVTDPAVIRSGAKVIPKGQAAIDFYDNVKRAANKTAPIEQPAWGHSFSPRSAAEVGTEQPAGGHAFSDSPSVEAAPAVAETGTPGQALAQSSGQDWAKLSGEDRAMLESVAKAQANAAAQPPRPPMGPPVAPAEAPAPTGPRMTAADELRAEMEAQRAAAPPVPETPQPALGGHDTTPAVSRGAPVRPPLRRPLPTETRAQYEAAINAPMSTAPVEATPVTQPPPAPGPVEVPMSTAQAEAAMAKKAPAPVEEPQSQYTASGERKSPQLRAAEITGKNVTAKAQRWAEALQGEGITAEDVGNMTPADLEVMNNGLQAKGRLPKGEKAPGQSLPEIVARLRKMGGETKQASAAVSPEPEVGTRLTPKQRELAEQMKAAMEEEPAAAPAAPAAPAAKAKFARVLEETPLLARDFLEAHKGEMTDDGARAIEMIGHRNILSEREGLELLRRAKQGDGPITLKQIQSASDSLAQEDPNWGKKGMEFGSNRIGWSSDQFQKQVEAAREAKSAKSSVPFTGDPGPSGNVSARSRAASRARTSKELFGENGLQKPTTVQPSAPESLRAQAKGLRELAGRGMKPKAYRAKAAELEAQADQMEQEGSAH